MTDKKRTVEKAAAELQAVAEVLDNLGADVISNSYGLVEDRFIEEFFHLASQCRKRAGSGLLKLRKDKHYDHEEDEPPF